MKRNSRKIQVLECKYWKENISVTNFIIVFKQFRHVGVLRRKNGLTAFCPGGFMIGLPMLWPLLET